MDWPIKDRELFGQEIWRERRKLEYTQRDLAMNVSKYLSVPIGQRKISDIERGMVKTALPVPLLSALKKVLSLSDDILALAMPQSQKAERLMDNWISVNGDRYIQVSAQSNDLIPYLGEYHFVFRSTVREEDKLIRGLLYISSSNDGSCSANMDIYGENEEIIKKYSGIFFVNTYYDTCYFILCGTNRQEVCMLIAPRFKVTVARNDLIMPLVLTTSAGPTKRPTVHRMIISRQKLYGEYLDLAISQLYLNTDMVYLTQSQLDALKIAIDNRLSEEPSAKHYLLAKKYCEDIEVKSEKEYVYKIEELEFLDRLEACKDSEIRGLATAIIRKNSVGEYHNKIGKSGQKIMNTILKWMEED